MSQKMPSVGEMEKINDSWQEKKLGAISVLKRQFLEMKMSTEARLNLSCL